VPGDRIVVRPGFYSDPVVIRRGGTQEAPITLQAEERGTVIVDCRKDVDCIITLANAPHVVIDGFELRWFKQAAVTVNGSTNVSVRHCMIWNEPWLKGIRRKGVGVLAEGSPRIEVRHCVLFAMNRAIILRGCPRFRVTHNTATALTHGVCTFQCHDGVNSVDGVAVNNSFTFTSNYHFTLLLADHARQSLTCDYNNVAMFLRPSAAEKSPAEELMNPQDGDFQYYLRGQKALASDYGRPVISLKEWREKGFGAHSILARPMYVDPWNRDFRLKPGSPNTGAGKDGATIGALGVAE
jgi:hypothetical protein